MHSKLVKKWGVLMSKTNIIDGKEYTNEEAHRLLWNWLADNPGKNKCDFMIKHKVPLDEYPKSLCYACAECNSECEKCPIKWKDEMHQAAPCTDVDSIYWEWNAYGNSAIARQIAQMEWHVHEK